MSKIRVAMFNRDLTFGGNSRTLYQFVKYLNKDVFEPFVCGERGGDVTERLRKMGVEVCIFGTDLNKLVNYLKNHSVNIFHVYRYGAEEPFHILAAKKAGVPIIIEHNIFGAVDKSPSSYLIDHHLFISKFCAIRYMKMTGMSLEQFWKKRKVIYSSIDLGEFQELSQTERGILRQRLGLQEQDFVIGRFGRPDPTKWSDTFIPAIPKLVERSNKIKVVIVGITDEEKKRNEEIIRKFKDNIIILGWPVALGKEHEFYSVIDALVMITRWGETFGAAVVEGMSCRRPVIVNSTPLQSNAQIEVVDHGKTGLVVVPPRDLFKAICLLFENRRRAEAMGIAGYEKVKAQYDVEKTTKIIEKVYIESLLKKGIRVDKQYVKMYDCIQYFPSKEDIERFRQEYEFRVRNCYGASNFRYIMEMLAYKYLLSYSTLTYIKPLVKLLRKMLLPSRYSESGKN